MANSAIPKWTTSASNRRLEKAVCPLLKPLGFRKEKYGFSRQALDSYLEVFVGPKYQSGAFQQLGMTFAVTCLAINRVTSCYFRREPALRKNDSKIRTLSLRILAPERLEFEVRSFEELEQTVPIFVSVFQDLGLRFLDAAATVAGINRILNSEELAVDFPWLDAWGRVALVAAFLNKNPDFDRVIERALQHSQGLIEGAHEERVTAILRQEEGLPFLISDLQNGILRNFERDGEHPDLPYSVEVSESFDRSSRESAGKVESSVSQIEQSGLVLQNPDEAARIQEFPIGDQYDVAGISGFDFGNEPEIRIYPEGHLMVVFEFMPPMAWEMDGNDEEAFGVEMSSAIGVDVIEEDRGFFLVTHPAQDTVERISDFVANYRQLHGYTE
jgi:hypothetical protein